MTERASDNTGRFGYLFSEISDEDRSSLPLFDEVVPESALIRQADLLDALRPRGLREAENLDDDSSAAIRLRNKAYSAAMNLAKPLKAEIEHILDYIDAVTTAYRQAAERIEKLEAELTRLRDRLDEQE